MGSKVRVALLVSPSYREYVDYSFLNQLSVNCQTRSGLDAATNGNDSKLVSGGKKKTVGLAWRCQQRYCIWHHRNLRGQGPQQFAVGFDEDA